MKKVLLLAFCAIFALSAMADVASPTRLDNMRSLGMGRAYTANGLDRIGIFFYNPAAIQNVDFSKMSLFNFTLGVSMDWQDMYDDIEDLIDENLTFFDSLSTATDSQKVQSYYAIKRTLQDLTKLYDDTGSFYFQEFGSWTNKNGGLGFSFFVKAGIDLSFIPTKAGELFGTAAELTAINLGADLVENGIDPFSPTLVADIAAAGGLAIDGIDAATGNPYFSANTEIPGILLKNYIDYGLAVTKGFTKPLNKKYKDAKDFARLDYGVTAKMIFRTSVVDKDNPSFEGIRVAAADYASNEDNDTEYDDISESRLGFDVGAILHTKDSMNTRIGFSIMDIVSSDYSDTFEAPDAQVNVGIALRPFRFAENTFMRKVDVAVDLQDLTNSDKDIDQQLKIGVEGRTTSMLTWRLGFSNQQLSQGIDFKMGKLGSFTLAHYYDTEFRLGTQFDTEKYAFQFKMMF